MNAVVSRRRQVAAWLVHLFTATAGLFGLGALLAIHRGSYPAAFWCMAAAVIIDGLDGTLARAARVTVAAPRIDGALLDNLVDYLNYVVVPAFLVLVTDLVPAGWRGVAAGAMVLSSAYQFSQRDAKTADHFFKGFPSYWNIVVFYLVAWQTSPVICVSVILALAVLVFVPVKYVYPTRPAGLTASRALQRVMIVATIAWAAATVGLLWMYPRTDPWLNVVVVGYLAIYLATSLYRTARPLPDIDRAGGPL
jgi:phosphatidylcholine synthase